MSTVKPQVIDDEEHERVHDRVAAVDVAKDAGVVCTRTPHPSRPGARRASVWTVKARMNAVRVLGRQLRKDGIEIVTLEAGQRLLADLVLRPGSVRAGGPTGQRGPGEEPAWPAQDRPVNRTTEGGSAARRADGDLGGYGR